MQNIAIRPPGSGEMVTAGQAGFVWDELSRGQQTLAIVPLVPHTGYG